jgi:uncharacterized protein (DUF4415 family)
MNGNKGAIGSDLAKLDAAAVTADDLAEIPELTDDWFDRAVVHHAGVPAARGRPKAAAPRQAVSLRLSRRVVDWFRAGGPGWQTRINAVLEQWLNDHPGGVA